MGRYWLYRAHMALHASPDMSRFVQALPPGSSLDEFTKKELQKLRDAVREDNNTSTTHGPAPYLTAQLILLLLLLCHAAAQMKEQPDLLGRLSEKTRFRAGEFRDGRDHILPADVEGHDDLYGPAANKRGGCSVQ